MNIRVLEFCRFYTGGALPATVCWWCSWFSYRWGIKPEQRWPGRSCCGFSFFAGDVLCKGQCKRQSAAAFFAQQQQGMAQPVLLQHIHEVALRYALVNHIFELHVAKIRIRHQPMKAGVATKIRLCLRALHLHFSV